MRRAARRDDNEAAIVEALKRAGISVEVIGKPLDLLLNARFFCPHCKQEIANGRTTLMEVKNADGFDRITREQAEFIQRWPGCLSIARSPEEAVALAVGAEAMK